MISFFRKYPHLANFIVGNKYLFPTILFLHIFLAILFFISDSFTGRGFDESVVYIFYTGLDGLELDGYIYLLASTILLLILGLYLSIKITHHWPLIKNASAGFRSCLNLFLLALLVGQPVSIYFFVNSSFFNEFADRRRIDFVPVNLEQISLQSKPNIVYIYAEGLERTFLDNSIFPGLTPNLSRLESEGIAFSNLRAVYGMRWTIAGMTASQCGLPLQPIPGANNPGTFMPKAYCLGDILSENGYQLSYLGGASLTFGGKGNFYTTHSFDNVNGREQLLPNLPKSTPLSEWGIYDDVIFDLAEKEYKKLAETDKPFGLFLLTLDTHPPEGLPSAACAKTIYADGKNPMLNAVHCSDKLISQFVEKLRADPGYENTIIIISSDHLSPANTASERLEQSQYRRKLFFALGKQIKPELNLRSGSTLDIAPTLLTIMGTEIKALNLGVSLLGKQPTILEQSTDVDTDLRFWSTNLKNYY